MPTSKKSESKQRYRASNVTSRNIAQINPPFPFPEIPIKVLADMMGVDDTAVSKSLRLGSVKHTTMRLRGKRLAFVDSRWLKMADRVVRLRNLKTIEEKIALCKKEFPQSIFPVEAFCILRATTRPNINRGTYYSAITSKINSKFVPLIFVLEVIERDLAQKKRIEQAKQLTVKKPVYRQKTLPIQLLSDRSNLFEVVSFLESNPDIVIHGTSNIAKLISLSPRQTLHLIKVDRILSAILKSNEIGYSTTGRNLLAYLESVALSQSQLKSMLESYGIKMNYSGLSAHIVKVRLHRKGTRRGLGLPEVRQVLENISGTYLLAQNVPKKIRPERIKAVWQAVFKSEKPSKLFHGDDVKLAESLKEKRLPNNLKIALLNEIISLLKLENADKETLRQNLYSIAKVKSE